jgi:hypothetical protein
MEVHVGGQAVLVVSTKYHTMNTYGKEVKLSLCFNCAPRHGGVLESGGIAPLII